MTAALLPTLLVLLAALTVPSWSRDAPLRTAGVVAGFTVLLAIYLHWRVTVTVLPAAGVTPAAAFVWVVFLAELWLWYETLQLALILLRRTDRSAEADCHESRLSAMNPSDLPAVDIFIATYNEPLDVLEKTIAGALALDWPHNRLSIHVLDDGRRDWLRDYCQARGINHLTRKDNRHAKAGNINAALTRTRAPFILVLDADFVPQRRMLKRAMGFFEDPKIGIVQMPHHFFNSTPLQASLDMRASLPDEQRFFFDVIQPGRDGWNCAFCCGSNGIIRRAALDDIGGAIPTESITEDMLLTLALLRRGYITRYLGERLAIGLAPENLDAYFVQRARWAQGAVQMLFSRNGPLRSGLTPLQRLMFNPSHWLSQSICQPIAMATPAIFLLTGWPPLVNAGIEDILFYQLPAIFGALALMHFLAPREFSPIASSVESVLQSFKLMPVVLLTLFRPNGHGFKVTPKGSDAGLAREDRFTILIAFSLILATGIGLMLNTRFATRVVAEGELLPIVAFWSVYNMIILLIVATVAVPRPANRAEERFEIEGPARLALADRDIAAESVNISLSGILVRPFDALASAQGDWVGVTLPDVGLVPAVLRRRFDGPDGPRLGLSFHIPDSPTRDRLIQCLFADSRKTIGEQVRSKGASLTMLRRIFGEKAAQATQVTMPDPGPVPDWLCARMAEGASMTQTGWSDGQSRELPSLALAV